MNGPFRMGVLAFAAAALVAMPGLTGSEVAAQDASGRFLVLIPDFYAEEGANRNFGEDTAEELRDAMSELPSYTAIDKDEIEDNLDRFDLRMRDLECIDTRQLGTQMNAQVAVCARYTDLGSNQVEVDVEFWSLEAQTSFSIDPFTIDRRQDEEAARQILDAFTQYTEALNVRSYCFQYAQENAYDDALRNCTQVLEANPSDTRVRKQIARIYFEQAESGTGEDATYDEDLLRQALEEIEQVVEEDQLDEEALQLAGYIATQLGQNDIGRDYYSQYLDLNPQDVQVRLTIAYDVHQAGDSEGAMMFVKEGLEIEESADLWLAVGNYAFAAAAQAQQEAGSENGGGIGPDVATLYEEAATAYMNAFDEKGAEMSAGALRNVINAQLRLDRVDQAIEIAERILEVRTDEAPLWAAYGTALQRAERTDEALEAMARVEELDPDYNNLYAIQGRWLLDQGRLDDAVQLLERAVDRGSDPNSMARLIFADAHPIGTQENDYGTAIRYLQAAKRFDVSSAQREELDFWHGYFLLQQGRAEQEPQTLETARATLPKFQRARELLQAATGYGETRPTINVREFIDNVTQFIEIQEAIISRSGGE